MSDNPEKKGYWDRVLEEPIEEWFPWGITALIVAVFAVIIVVGPLGVPHRTEVEQAGFRGTGMATVYKAEEYAESLTQLDGLIPDDPPYEYGPDEDPLLAGEAYENVQVLGDVTEDNFLRLMTAITNWVSPEQGCEYCHGLEGGFAADNLYTKVVSRRMLQMTRDINANWGDHVAPSGVNCYTCHRGQNVPQYLWFNQEPQEASTGGWLNNQNTANPRVALATLPNNIYEKYLMGDAEIRVIPQDPRVDTTGQDTKDTEWTYGLMIHMSKSLNVNCAYCHNTRAMSQWDQGPPARTTAWYGIRMVRELNNSYLAPLQPVYPDYRLGEMGDAPKANCTTCHQGVYKPLFGEPMVENWPELIGPTTAPVETAAAEEGADPAEAPASAEAAQEMATE